MSIPALNVTSGTPPPLSDTKSGNDSRTLSVRNSLGLAAILTLLMIVGN
jgi:hypothetical protein